MKLILFTVIVSLSNFSIAQAVEYKNFVSDAPPHENLVQYLTETTELSNSLAHDQLTDKEACDQVLKLRNRLDNIYTAWHLQLRSNLQQLLLQNLYTTLRSHSQAYVRLESAISLGIVGDASSIPFLKQATHDPDDLVRKYARESIVTINAWKERDGK